jgi:hypothetical protein
MNSRNFGILLLIIACSSPASRGDPIMLGADGSVSGRFHWEKGEPQSIVLRIGLPDIPAARRWRENNVLRSLWATNGICYTLTVLTAGGSQTEGRSGGIGKSLPALLINLAGENTNSEYAEAFAGVELEIAGKRQEVELNDGLLWRLERKARAVIGALQIPESGIKVSRGPALRFSGNMPPSLKGCMTLVLPLEPLRGEDSAERLKEIDFDQQLRFSTKPGNAPTHAPEGWRLLFTEEIAQPKAK